MGPALIGFGLFFFFRGFKAFKLKRQIMGLATSKVRSLAMGLVELAGIAEKGQPLKDPIYLESCAYYKVKVEEERGSGKNRHWVTVYSQDTSTIPFYLKDTTGKALIVPAGANLERNPTINCSNGVFFGGLNDVSVQGFLSKWGGFGRSVRLTAHIIRDNDPVYVLGYVSPKVSSLPEVTVSSFDAAEKIKNTPTLMTSMDTNNDGQIDSMEWETGVKSVKKEMDAQKLKQEMAKPPVKEEEKPPVVTKSPDGIMILGSDENDIVRKLSWSSLFQVVGGPVMVVAGIYILQLMLLGR